MEQYMDPMMAQLMQQQMGGPLDMMQQQGMGQGMGQGQGQEGARQYVPGQEYEEQAAIADPYFLLLSPEERRRRREQERMAMQQGMGQYPSLTPFSQQWGY